MPLIRATWFFQQLEYGWTETLWIDGASLDAVPVQQAVDRYAQKRIKLSGAQTRLKYYRISLEGVFRDARGFTYPGGGLAGMTGKASDAPQVALLTYFRTLAGGSTRLQYLRGIWDEIVFEGGTYTPGADFISRFDDWRAQVFNDAWGWYGVTARQQANVTAVVQDPAGTVSVTLDGNIFAGPPFVGTTVRIAGVLGATQINGQQIITPTAANAFKTRRRISIFPWTTGGRVTNVTKGLIPVQVIAPFRIVERKVGRPSYLSRGRRPARAAS